MEICKIVAIGIISVILIAYLKTVNSEIAVIAGVASGLLIIILSLTYVKDFVMFFSELSDKGGLDGSVFKLSLKIIAISYLVDFSSGVASDFGQAALGEKIQFAGKVIMTTLAMPLISEMIRTVVGLL